MSRASFPRIEAVILDIEGTVAPITFVKDTLFPYALRVLPDYLAKNWSSSSFQPTLAQFPSEARVSREAFVDHVRDLTSRDVKVAYLKNLQGILWREGYKSGELVTPLYDDVIPQIKAWKDSGRKLAIFSSGSVEAQKMFFGHVGLGDDAQQEDLRQMFEPHWFDTVNAGPKFEASSYQKIVREMNTEAGEALFLSDHIKGKHPPFSSSFNTNSLEEVQAALSAGLHAVLILRPGNPPQDGDGVVTAHSLGEIDLQGRADQ